MHDGEQIVPHQAGPHFNGVRIRDGGIVGGDEQRLYRGIVGRQQRLPQFQVVDCARRRGAGGFADSVIIQVERRRGREQRAATVTAVSAGDAWQQRNGAQIVSAIGVTTQPETNADEGFLRGAVHRREIFHLCFAQTGDFGGVRGGEAGENVRLDPVEPVGVGSDISVIRFSVAHQDVHDAEREGGIGSDTDREVNVGGTRRAGPAGVDHHQFYAAGPGLLDLRPEMHVGGV